MDFRLSLFPRKPPFWPRERQTSLFSRGAPWSSGSSPFCAHPRLRARKTEASASHWPSPPPGSPSCHLPPPNLKGERKDRSPPLSLSFVSHFQGSGVVSSTPFPSPGRNRTALTPMTSPSTDGERRGNSSGAIAPLMRGRGHDRLRGSPSFRLLHLSRRGRERRFLSESSLDLHW